MRNTRKNTAMTLIVLIASAACFVGCAAGKKVNPDKIIRELEEGIQLSPDLLLKGKDNVYTLSTSQADPYFDEITFRTGGDVIEHRYRPDIERTKTKLGIESLGNILRDWSFSVTRVGIPAPPYIVDSDDSLPQLPGGAHWQVYTVDSKDEDILAFKKNARDQIQARASKEVFDYLFPGSSNN